MNEKFNPEEHSHTRLNILTGEWILVSPHRTKRPWQGKVESLESISRPSYDPKCYLCPGNTRADGAINPVYENSFSFTNDYSSLLKDTPEGNFNIDNLLIAKSEKGICRVISFSPDHDKTLPDLTIDGIKKVIELWKSEYQSLRQNPFIHHIQIFENKGEIMGCSNPHPHGQIWAQSGIPAEVVKETAQQKLYFEKNNNSLLSAYVETELKERSRIVYENSDFLVVVPYWATWPFETLLISKRHLQDITQFTSEEKESLADALKTLTMAYDKVFDVSFPYSAGMHQGPVNDGDHPEWHWHMHFYPPLLRSATVKKFMVGYELLANAQRDITAESAAARLRECVNLIKY